MTDIGLQLTFADPEAAVAFSRELGASHVQIQEFRVATLEPKLNMDADTIFLVVKHTGEAVGAVGSFLKLGQTILKRIRKPAVRIEIDGKIAELSAQASDDDIRELCDILVRSKK